MGERTKLFIALPVYGAFDPWFIQSLIKLLDNPPCHIALRIKAGDSLIPRARNSLTADFLASDASHLLFVDTDLIFSREHIERIISHPEPVVAGFYPKKQDGPIQWVVNGCIPDAPVRPDGLQEVRYAGSGFIRIAREVFERMIREFGSAIAYKTDPPLAPRTEHDFWSVGTYHFPDGTVRYLSEDWFFCQRWLDCGGKVWADTKIILKHVGTAIYPLLSQQGEITRPGPEHNFSDGSDGGPADASRGPRGLEVLAPPSPAREEYHRALPSAAT